MVTTMRPLPRALALLALLAGCGLDAPKQYLVPDLRVAAVRASAGGGPSADADIDEPVTLEALVLNPLGRTGVNLEWYGCLPAIPPAVSPCEDPALLGDPQALRALARPAPDPAAVTGPFLVAAGAPVPVTFDLTVEQEAILTAATLAPEVGLIARAGTTSKRLQCALYFPIPVVVIVTEDSGEVTEVALTRVRIAPSEAQAAFPGTYVLNFNPVIEEVQIDPVDEDACTGGLPLADPLPGGGITLCGRPQDGSKQGFYECGEDGPPRLPDGSLAPTNATEALAWQWYVTAGEIAQAGFDGNATENPIDLTPPAGPFTLWTILRDGRGGTDWEAFSLGL